MMYDPEFYYKRRYRSNSIMTTMAAKESVFESFNSYMYIITELSKMLEQSNSKLEKKLIKKRIRKLYGITSNFEVGRKAKKELNKKTNLNSMDKLFYFSIYRIKKYFNYDNHYPPEFDELKIKDAHILYNSEQIIVI